MARFMGTVQGSRGEASRLGGADAGITTHAAGWGGAIRVHVYDKDGADWARVEFTHWQGRGGHSPIYDGPLVPDDATRARLLAACGVEQ